MIKISPLNKRSRQKGTMPGGPSCTSCCKGKHQECEDFRYTFCNCWRSKHTLPKKDVHHQPRSQNPKQGTVGHKANTKKKGSK